MRTINPAVYQVIINHLRTKAYYTSTFTSVSASAFVGIPSLGYLIEYWKLEPPLASLDSFEVLHRRLRKACCVLISDIEVLASDISRWGNRSLAVVLGMVVLMCVSVVAQVSAQSSPAPAPYMRGWEPSSAPGYAPEYAPSYAPAWAPEYVAPAGAPAGSPTSAPPPYAFTPSPSITIYEPNLAPGPMSA